eukprot:2017767-Rhodomonas_salina.3
MLPQPHGTMKALTAKHDEFKISVLAQIQSLFDAEALAGRSHTPKGCVFAGGFGNSDTDILAYDYAGIPRTHIFVADRSSRVKNLETGTDFQSYTGLRPHLDKYFPGRDQHPYCAAPAQSREAKKPMRRSSSEGDGEQPWLSHVTRGIEDMLPLKVVFLSSPSSSLPVRRCDAMRCDAT